MKEQRLKGIVLSSFWIFYHLGIDVRFMNLWKCSSVENVQYQFRLDFVIVWTYFCIKTFLSNESNYIWIKMECFAFFRMHLAMCGITISQKSPNKRPFNVKNSTVSILVCVAVILIALSLNKANKFWWVYRDYISQCILRCLWYCFWNHCLENVKIVEIHQKSLGNR